jgi:hypothetical protein
MNEYDVKRLALVLAVQAEIEGMKSENAYREVYGHEPTHNEGSFQEKAEKLRNLAYSHNEQL